MSQQRYGNYQSFSRGAELLRQKHREAAKLSQDAADKAYFAWRDLEAARGLASEITSRKSGAASNIDDEMADAIDTVRERTNDLWSAIRINNSTTNDVMETLHDELEHIHAELTAIYGILGVSTNKKAGGATQSNGTPTQTGGNTTQSNGAAQAQTAAA